MPELRVDDDVGLVWLPVSRRIQAEKGKGVGDCLLEPCGVGNVPLGLCQLLNQSAQRVREHLDHRLRRRELRGGVLVFWLG